MSRVLTGEKQGEQAAADAAGGAVRSASAATARFAFVAPQFAHDPHWSWLSGIGPFAAHPFAAWRIPPTFTPWPKLTRLYQQWQYAKVARALRENGVDLTFLFSPDVAIGLTGAVARPARGVAKVWVGYHQDRDLPRAQIERIGRAARRCSAVTVLTEEERSLYIPRYDLDPQRTLVVPLHTDHTRGYAHYADEPPLKEPYILALGSPNRLFMPTARAAAKLNIPIVIITRPWHRHDDLNALREAGARVITDADMTRSLTYLKHARFQVMDFIRTDHASGFITLVHAMFLRTPSIVTECVGVREHVIDGETGRVIAHGDEAALTEAMEELWNDEPRSQHFGEKAWQRAQQRHSLEAAAERFHAIALEILR